MASASIGPPKPNQCLQTRNVHVISGLMESKVDFVCCDMPDANRLTIHILAAVAEHEREMISQRTKAGRCPAHC
jgi:DNA invertase Pin-like site-specific DNA recombinase